MAAAIRPKRALWTFENIIFQDIESMEGIT